MNEDLDARLGRLLRAAAPPERDPMFRIRVLERRERQRFQHRSRLLAVFFTALAVLPTLLFALTPEPLLAALALVFGIACLGASFASVRGVLQFVRQMRGS